MKSAEQVLTEVAKDEFLFDMGHGPVILNQVEMQCAYETTLERFAGPPEKDGEIVTKIAGTKVQTKQYSPELAAKAQRHYSNGMLDSYSFMDFLRFEGFEEIIEAGRQGQIRRQQELGLFVSPWKST